MAFEVTVVEASQITVHHTGFGHRWTFSVTSTGSQRSLTIARCHESLATSRPIEFLHADASAFAQAEARRRGLID